MTCEREERSACTEMDTGPKIRAPNPKRPGNIQLRTEMDLSYYFTVQRCSSLVVAVALHDKRCLMGLLWFLLGIAHNCKQTLDSIDHIKHRTEPVRVPGRVPGQLMKTLSVIICGSSINIRYHHCRNYIEF